MASGRRPTARNWANRLCPVILQAFSPGMAGGATIVEALFGGYIPGGKLTCTMPRTAGQLPMNFPAKPAADTEVTHGVNVTGLLWPIASLAVAAGTALRGCSGGSNAHGLECSANLANPSGWVGLATNISSGFGRFSFANNASAGPAARHRHMMAFQSRAG